MKGVPYGTGFRASHGAAEASPPKASIPNAKIAYRFWGEAEDASLTLYWASGYTGAAIARLLGRSRGSVMGRINRLGLLRHAYPRSATRLETRPPPRDPCTYCGTRGDFGCKHRRAA